MFSDSRSTGRSRGGGRWVAFLWFDLGGEGTRSGKVQLEIVRLGGGRALNRAPCNLQNRGNSAANGTGETVQGFQF